MQHLYIIVALEEAGERNLEHLVEFDLLQLKECLKKAQSQGYFDLLEKI